MVLDALAKDIVMVWPQTSSRDVMYQPSQPGESPGLASACPLLVIACADHTRCVLHVRTRQDNRQGASCERGVAFGSGERWAVATGQ